MGVSSVGVSVDEVTSAFCSSAEKLYKMASPCGNCNKTVYKAEELRCLDKVNTVYE